MLVRHPFQLSVQYCLFQVEPGHEKMCFMSYANNKGTDQPAHQRSLISAFVVRLLDSIISVNSTVLRFVSCLVGDTFSHGVDHLF